MVDRKYSQFDAAAALAAGDQVVGLQAGKNVRILVSAIRAGLADDTNVVHRTGDESIAGEKIFTGRPVFNIGGRIPASQQLRWSDGTTDFGAVTANVAGVMTIAGTVAAGTGGVQIRPNGVGLATNQFLINPDGSTTWTGNAASKSATRASLDVPGLAGTNLYGDTARWNIGTVGSIEYGTPNSAVGIVLKSGVPVNVNSDADMWRHDIRALNGLLELRVGSVVGNVQPPRGLLIKADGVTPSNDNVMDFGSTVTRWKAGFFAGDVTSRGFVMGYLDNPLNVQNAAYTFTLADRGKCVQKTSSGTANYTIPLDSVVAFPDGAFINLAPTDAAGSMAIVPASGVTLYLAGSRATVGTRTIAAGGLASIMRMGANLWCISGAGVT